MSVNEKVLDAIELLATNSIKKAGYDKTIQAQIVSCEDKTTGKYKCKYQDATFYAYTNNPDASYMKDVNVYVLIPSNDMSKQKTILGSVERMGLDYINTATGEQAYNIIGENCITKATVDSNQFLVDKSNPDLNDEITLYAANNNSLRFLNININNANYYIKQSSSLIVAVTISTELPQNKQYDGHYGIIYNLAFKDDNGNRTIRSYILNEDHIIGNPYNLTTPTRQYQIFDIDGQNFIQIQSIKIFSNYFPGSSNLTNTTKLTDGYIKLTKFQLYGAKRMTQTELNGVAISFYTPQGTFFTSSALQSDYKTIKAQIKVKGQLVTDVKRVKFFWGIEDLRVVNISHTFYNKYLGKGWRCLNKSISSITDDNNNPIIQWASAQDTYILNYSDAKTKNNRLKVAILYQDNIITKQINIQNLAVNIPVLTITSSKGTNFINDIGQTDLVCTCILNNQDITNQCTFSWGYYDNNNIFYQLEDTTNLNILNNYQRVEGNKIYNFLINNIKDYIVFKCSVARGTEYLGTASIKILNTIQNQKKYSLVINNGNQVFQYNEYGIAPNNESLFKPQEIKALTFSIFDKNGDEMPIQTLISNGVLQVEWKVPKENTLLIPKNANGILHQNDENYIYYNNVYIFTYDIVQNYDFKKVQNQIELTVRYKDLTLITHTNFTFIKQGELGTSGTDYLVKLVPNTGNKNVYLPIITKIGNGDNAVYKINYKIGVYTGNQDTITPEQGKALLKAELWRQGEKLWSGITVSNGEDIDGDTNAQVTFKILRNVYYNKNSIVRQDNSHFSLSSNNTLIYNGNNFQLGGTNLTSPLANTIECTIFYNEKYYYTALPILTAWVSNNNYRISLKPYTGFFRVLYSSDGLYPQYDNSKPFEIILQEKINDVWEDISSLCAFTFNVSGNTQIINSGSSATIASRPNSNNLKDLKTILNDNNLKNNQCICKPSSKYDGECVNNTLTCRVTRNSVAIASISIPIYFSLNTYGLSQLNQWDGNSIKIDNQGGYILTPQVGAGIKESNNTFSGILMGQLQEPARNKKIGLFGFNKGNKTIFLNSKNGSAIFGKQGGGQIIIDPSVNKSLIYSNDYWLNYDLDTGLPSNYNSNNENHAGLIIDLSKPQIKYGNGKFEVDDNGNITANGSITATSGKIAGWTIDGTKLIGTASSSSTGTSYESIVLDANRSRIYSGNKSEFSTTGDGFHLSPLGLVFGDSFKFRTKHLDSNDVLQPAALELGYLNGKHWTIKGDSSANKSYISYGTAGSNGSVYIGTDKITLGSNFSVNSNGKLEASDVDLSGKITASSGWIGDWEIKSRELKAGNLSLDYEGSISGPYWSINANGDAYFGKIYGTVMSGQSLFGNGFTLGGGGNGAASWIDPYSVTSPSFNGVGAAGTLSKALHAQFDTISARQADINTVNASIVNVRNTLNASIANIDSLNTKIGQISETLVYNNTAADWVEVVQNISNPILDVYEDDHGHKYLRIQLYVYSTKVIGVSDAGGGYTGYRYDSINTIYLN